MSEEQKIIWEGESPWVGTPIRVVTTSDGWLRAEYKSVGPAHAWGPVSDPLKKMEIMVVGAYNALIDGMEADS